MATAFQELHPCFHAGLAAAARAIAHEGRIEAEPGQELYEAAEGAIHLQAALKGTRIRKAAHRGAEDPAGRAVLEAFCAAIVGLPLREAADHGGQHTIGRLRDEGLGAPVPGILTPASAGAPFALPPRLIRRIHAAFQGRGGARDVNNPWAPGFSKAWLKLGRDGQTARLGPVIDRFLTERGLRPGDIRLLEVEKGSRVVVAFQAHIGHRDKPALLLALERACRAASGERLEVFMEEMMDANKIRRT